MVDEVQLRPVRRARLGRRRQRGAHLLHPPVPEERLDWAGHRPGLVGQHVRTSPSPSRSPCCCADHSVFSCSVMYNNADGLGTTMRNAADQPGGVFGPATWH